jgi:phosphoglycolate/pyridoxal phosphate phosphatase family enzyme
LKGVILDLDGVLRRGRSPIPGSVEAVHVLASRGISICYLTNNSTRKGSELISELMNMGYPEAEMVTSAQAASMYILGEHGPSRCLVVGERGLLEELGSAGHEAFMAGDLQRWTGFDHVVAGLDRGLTYEKIRDALGAIREGATFIATNRDPTLPQEDGSVVPGAGTTISAIKTCTGKNPIVVGKPEPFSTRMALKRLKLEPQEVLMIGDRPDTDILAGERAGCQVAMVLTGDVKEPENADYPVFRDLNNLVKELF